MKSWLFLLWLIGNSGALLAQQTKLKKDTAYVAPRSFDKTALKDFKSQKDFQYDKLREPPLSLWDKFWNWFWWKVGQLYRTTRVRITFWIVLVLLGIAGIVFLIMKVTGMDQGGLFGRNSKNFQNNSLLQNNIHLISFDDEIEKAISKANYRLATRLQYLQALKNLSDKGYIKWRINKTNTDYLTEVTGRPFNAMFASLTLNFEYTWYGEKQVSREQFFEIRKQFHQFNNQV